MAHVPEAIRAVLATGGAAGAGDNDEAANNALESTFLAAFATATSADESELADLVTVLCGVALLAREDDDAAPPSVRDAVASLWGLEPAECSVETVGRGDAVRD